MESEYAVNVYYIYIHFTQDISIELVCAQDCRHELQELIWISDDKYEKQYEFDSDQIRKSRMHFSSK